MTNILKPGQALEDFASAHTEAAIAGVCRRFADALDFDAFIYAYRAPTSFAQAEVIQISGYPAAWLDRYWEVDHYAIDPVIAYCGQNVLPVAWHDLLPRAPIASLRMMNEASECGLQWGLSMPMHGPRGELGILSLARAGAKGAGQAAIAAAQPYVQMFAGHVHEAVRRVTAAGGDVSVPQLSAREQECLRWASDGKTSWEISVILGISERTVNFHIDNSVVKLKAANRQHALVKAVALGTLRPRPF